MRTVRLQGEGRVAVVEVAEPVPGSGEVLVATAASGICGSELGAYRGKGIPSGNGGHEAAGTVVALGPGVSSPQLGQRVGVSAVAGCGCCSFCELGRYTYCAKYRVYTAMHAERFVAAANACQYLPDDIDWGAGVLLSGDGLGVPYHSTSRLVGTPVRTVAVFGCGPIGLGHVLLQTHLGRDVFAVDLVEARLALAQRLGAKATVNAAMQDPVAGIRGLTAGAGPDLCVEATGKPEPLRQCFAAVRTAGTVLINGEQPKVELSPSSDFIRRDVAAVGAWFYHFSEFDAMVALARAGLRISDLITHRFPLEDAATAFAEFAAGRTGKVLLVY